MRGKRWPVNELHIFPMSYWQRKIKAQSENEELKRIKKMKIVSEMEEV